MPMCSNGESDMFEPNPFDYDAFATGCKLRWGVTPRPEWALIAYGGRDIRDVTNIIFSNGGLDPWSGGGVLQNLSSSLVSIWIPEGAHHLDLRSSNKDDPESVTVAREKEKAIIQGWIEKHRNGDDKPGPHVTFRWIKTQGIEHARTLSSCCTHMLCIVTLRRTTSFLL